MIGTHWPVNIQFFKLHVQYSRFFEKGQTKFKMQKSKFKIKVFATLTNYFKLPMREAHTKILHFALFL
ncbi:MAG: hypothetical protein A3J76_02570 [Candidatus Moranbacteria bacterium RBG_13_45_13]|nr:MAG: hypothetical protein A3J76_02570 [Candidatus Moranbacteria bacterium RBG_13_45_13]